MQILVYIIHRYYDLPLPKHQSKGYFQDCTFAQAFQHRAASRVLPHLLHGIVCNEAILACAIAWEEWQQLSRWERQPGQMTREGVERLKAMEVKLHTALAAVLVDNRMASIKVHKVTQHQADHILSHSHPVNSDTQR